QAVRSERLGNPGIPVDGRSPGFPHSATLHAGYELRTYRPVGNPSTLTETHYGGSDPASVLQAHRTHEGQGFAREIVVGGRADIERISGVGVPSHISRQGHGIAGIG